MIRKKKDQSPADTGADLNEIFDLDRKDVVKKLVTEMEQCLHDAMIARENLKEIVAHAREYQFSAWEAVAMRKLAKLRLDDKLGTAREEIDALRRISYSLEIDLFGPPPEGEPEA